MQYDIINRIELPEGIAKNFALRENVFTLLVCILKKIPVILTGLFNIIYTCMLIIKIY